MNTMNIMTSCDEGLARHILPQLASISVNMPDRRVNFYLLHYRVCEETLGTLSRFADALGNIRFMAVRVSEADVGVLARLDEIGRGYMPETYFSAIAHKYLPDVDRALYIDAGDVIIDGDLSPYYDCPFDGKAMVVTATYFRPDVAGLAGESPLFGLADYENYDPKKPHAPITHGFFNSGCFVINTAYMREIGFTAEELLAVGEALADMLGGDFLGDQAALSAAFPDEIKYYARDGAYDLSYRPFNFSPTLVDGEMIEADGKAFAAMRSGGGFRPVAYHYSGYGKPWRFRFTDEEYARMRKNLPPLAEVRKFAGLPEFAYREMKWFYEVYWRYCAMTPIYDEVSREARIAGAVMKSGCLPSWLWGYENRKKLDRAADILKRLPAGQAAPQ